MNKGFTIVELMVSITIMALMAGAVFFNWRPAEDTFALTRSAHQLADDIRGAQQMAVSTKPFACAATDADYSGFGVYLDDSQPLEYLLFENCSTDKRTYDSGEDVDLQVHNLEEGVQIQSINVDGLVGAVSVLFVPPNPKVYINNNISGVELVITLELVADSSQTRQVQVNTGGRIEID